MEVSYWPPVAIGVQHVPTAINRLINFMIVSLYVCIILLLPFYCHYISSLLVILYLKLFTKRPYLINLYPGNLHLED